MTNTHQSVVTYKKENIHVQIKYMKASLRFFTLAGEGSETLQFPISKGNDPLSKFEVLEVTTPSVFGGWGTIQPRSNNP